MPQHKKQPWLQLLFTVLGLTGLLWSQAETGQISGTVVDPSGAVVANATVSVRNAATGGERATASGTAGDFTVPNLQPGSYDVTATSPGFSTFKSRVTVAVGTKVGLDVKLQLGQTGTVVQVSESAVVVNTETQTIQQTLSTRQLTQLPSLNRNPYTSFVITAGNVSEDDPSGRGVGVAINGLRSAGTNVLLDGVANNDEFDGTYGQTVPLDSVEEVGIETSNFTAETGRASAGVINVTTKSGTNEFHGSGYEFNQVSALASNDFLSNAQGLLKPIYTRNLFGFSIGGPVVKNKLFFFNDTEWTRIRSNANETAWVIDPSYIAAAAPSAQQIYSQYKLASGVSNLGTFSRNQMIAQTGSDPCKGSPTSGGCYLYNANSPMFDLVNYSVPSNSGAGEPQNAYSTVSRVDYNLSDKTQIYARYALYSENDFAGSNSNSPYAGFNTGTLNYNNAGIVSITHAISPVFVSQSKLDFNRLNTVQPLSSTGIVPGYYLGNANVATAIGNYNVAMPGYLPYAPGSAIPFGGPQNFGEAYQDFSYNRGKHDIRFGGDFVYLRDNRSFGAYEEAVNVLGNNVGLGLSNLYAGQEYEFASAINPQGKFPCVGGVQTPACTITLPVQSPTFERSNRYREGALYVQDAFKVSKTITLNLGVRWEYYGVQHNVNANLDSNLYFPDNEPPQNPAFIPSLENAYVATVPNSPLKTLWVPSWTNFMPRLGFAWDVFGDGKTSVRGGYGIGDERNFGNVTFNVIQNPPNYAVVNLIAGSGGFTTIPLSASNAGILAGSSGSTALPPSSLRAVLPSIPQSYAQLMSASIEHEFFNNTHLEIDYSGSIGENLYDISGVNYPGTGNYYGGIPCTPGDCSALLNNQYSSINLRGAGGHSTYNAMNVRYDIMDIRHSGLTLRMNYTYSHSIDDLSDTFSSSGNQFNLGYTDFQHPEIDKGSSEFDNRHRIALSAIWDVPFARNMHGVAKKALDGWEFAPILTARTGAPFSIYDITNDNYVYTRVALNQAMPAATRTYAGPDSYNLWDFSTINTSEYVNPTYGVADFGPFPANMTGRDAFRTPGTWNLDLGMYKNIALTERASLQFRLEAYNAVNHANFIVSTGGAYIADGQGTVTGYYDGNRNVQIGAKVIF
ncbi:MAG TPA: carboxypeptidase regulatory-like domain-containing protein [Bryobacteraceae bacterium]|jgi:outer membrane receptor protein involved in Fe transport|nr:carboxypeptidase regulatory-like domain-containing protein [Bryobacteraceae bacterium]